MTIHPPQPREDTLIPFPGPADPPAPATGAELTPAPPVLDGELFSEQVPRDAARLIGDRETRRATQELLRADAQARWAKLGIATYRIALGGLLVTVLGGVLAIINAQIPRADMWPWLVAVYPLIGTNWLFGALAGQGKTATMRLLALGAALDVTTEIRIVNFKPSGDWNAFAPRASVLLVGMSIDVITACADQLEWLVNGHATQSANPGSTRTGQPTRCPSTSPPSKIPPRSTGSQRCSGWSKIRRVTGMSCNRRSLRGVTHANTCAA